MNLGAAARLQAGKARREARPWSAGAAPAAPRPGKSSCGRTIWPAARFAAADVCGFAIRKSSISEQVRRGLQRRIEDLGARVAALGNPQPIDRAGEPGLRSSRRRRARSCGWIVQHSGPGGGVTLDAQQKHGGAQSLQACEHGRQRGHHQRAVRSAGHRPAGDRSLAARGRSACGSRRCGLGVEGQAARRAVRSVWSHSGGGRQAHAPGDWVRYSFPLDNLPARG